MSQRQRKIEQTEKSAFAQLPGDIFHFDSRAIDKAASFGLVPMQEGWIVGGIIGKLAMARMRSEQNGKDRKVRSDFSCAHSGSATSQEEGINDVDPFLPAKSLLRLRTDLIKRGLIA